MQNDNLGFVVKFFSAPKVVLTSLFFFVVGTWLVWGGNFGIAYVISESGGVSVLDVGGLFSPNEAYAHIALMGVGGREAYKAFLIGIDMIYPALCAFLGISLITWSWQNSMRRSSYTPYLIVAPLLSALCDYLENYFIYQMLINYPVELPKFAELANLFHLGKPLFGVIGLLIFLVGIGSRFITLNKKSS